MIYKPDLLTVRDRNRFGTKGHSFLIDIDWVICIYVKLVVVCQLLTWVANQEKIHVKIKGHFLNENTG